MYIFARRLPLRSEEVLISTEQKQVGNYFYIFTIAMIAALAGLLFGYDTGVISGSLQYISKTFDISKSEYQLKEFIVSAVPLGALIGSIFSSHFSRKYGRHRSIIYSAILFIFGTAIVVGAFHISMIVIGRLFMGFAIGLSAMIVPMYLSEVSPPKIRGAVIFLFQLAITIGLLLAFIMNYIFADVESWRAMFAIGFIPSLLLAFGMLYLPFSPRWLILKGRVKEAKTILQKLRAQQDVMEELSEIEKSLKHPKGKLKDLFTKKMFPLVIITFGLFAFQQLSGINTIFYYAPTIFENAGFGSGEGSILPSIATGAINVFATIFGIWLVDRIGRRNLLFIGFTGMIVCLGVLGISYLGLLGTEIKWITLISVLLFIVFFAISLGGVPYVMMSELFPLKIRGVGMATASCANWGFNMIVSFTFLTFIHHLGIGATFLMYTGFTIIGCLFAFALLPETRGVPLEKIESNLYSGKKLRNLGEYQKKKGS